VQEELAEIIANHEYELQVVPQGSYMSSWLNCFKGSLWKGSSNLRRTILGTSLQMMQQWTGVNFIFYFGTTFFQELGTISNPFLINLVTTLVNVCSTPISFYIIERLGRRTILIWGAAGMVVCQFIVAIAGTVDGQNPSTVKAMIAFICIYIFFFATTWGPAAWVVIGEIFPLPIRSRAVGLSTSSNWLWNCVSACLSAPSPLVSRSTDLWALDHCRHYSVYGGERQGQSRTQGLLHLGLTLRGLLRLCLLFGPRNQGLDSRASRPHVGGDDTPHIRKMGAQDDLRRRDGSRREGHPQPRDHRGRQAPRLGCLKSDVASSRRRGRVSSRILLFRIPIIKRIPQVIGASWICDVSWHPFRSRHSIGEEASLA
jgi:hypothetical protein